MTTPTEPSRAVRLCGTDEIEAPVRLLRAGPLSAELDNGALRAIRVGEVEVIRAIAFLVRDENWGTLAPRLGDLMIIEDPEGFSVTYRATCADAKRTLVYDARITGRPDGSLDFEATAMPVTDVETNRTGFIVLHPVEGVAGHPVKVLHVDGREEASTFPDRIDPMQPFRDIRALTHEAMPGLWVTCAMTGDTFEMEDQRNWSDASYKTYVRPLALPWPYTLAKGAPMTQAVKLTVAGPLPAPVAAGAVKPVTVRLGAETGGLLPEIGIGVPAEEAEHALRHADLVRRLAPRALICQLDRRRGDGAAALARYRTLAERTGAAIVLEIVLPGGMDPAAELAPVAQAAREAGVTPAAITVFPAQDLKSVLPGSPWPDMPSFEAIYAAARAAFPGVRLGGGMATYFTELNRKRPPAGLIDFVTNTTCPTVHAADDRSVMETLEALPYQILSTRAFMGDRPMHIGPSTIGCRENPYGQATTPNPDNGRKCLSRLDPRQRGLFNAAYTVGYAAAFARGGIAALAMGAPTGPFGFIHRAMDGPQPFYGDRDGALYPAFHVMAGLAAGSGADLVEATSDRRSAVEALAWREGGGTVLLLANLTPDDQTVALAGVAPGRARAAVLDAASFVAAAGDPDLLAKAAHPLEGAELTLGSYAVARVEIG